MRSLGKWILATAPRMLALISWLGTVAIFCVGGGIVVHGIGPLHHFVEGLNAVLGLLAEGATGLLAGFLVLGLVKLVSSLRKTT